MYVSWVRCLTCLYFNLKNQFDLPEVYEIGDFKSKALERERIEDS